jgi:NAD(P)-dependent dehydrogenase (short-subunit alcohol dehydrogenase family)
MSDPLLTGRVALVTGGARGIGRAIVAELIARRASVVVADSGVSIAGEHPDPNVAQAYAAELGEHALAYSADISEPDSAQAVVDAALRRFGALDILINNAAILRDAFIFKADPRNWDAVLAVNLTAPFRVLAAATPVMRNQAKAGRVPGQIINIGSSAGLYGNFAQAAYASAKAGLFGLTRVVAMDMLRSGVTCNAVVPFAATRVTESIQPANREQAQYKERALKVSPRHVAELLVYLCTQSARAVSGQVFGVRGREVFLFSQPRPVAHIEAPRGGWRLEDLGEAVSRQLTPLFTDLKTDLESFNSEPLV